MRIRNDLRTYVGTSISQAQIDGSYAFSYMGGRLKIYIRKEDGGYQGHIRYEGSRYVFNWHMPQDLYEIAKDLWTYLPRDAGKIIYQEIESHFDESLSNVQITDSSSDATLYFAYRYGYRFPEWESMIPNMRTTITIEDAVPGRLWDWVRLRRASNNMCADLWVWNRYWGSLTDRGNYTSPTITASGTAINNIHYVTQEEYDVMRENGGLQSNSLYCVLAN